MKKSRAKKSSAFDDDNPFDDDNEAQQVTAAAAVLRVQPSETRLLELVDALQSEPTLRLDRQTSVGVVNYVASFIRQTSDASFATAFNAWCKVSAPCRASALVCV